MRVFILSLVIAEANWRAQGVVFEQRHLEDDEHLFATRMVDKHSDAMKLTLIISNQRGEPLGKAPVASRTSKHKRLAIGVNLMSRLQIYVEREPLQTA